MSGDGLPVGEGVDEGSRAPKIGLFRLTADWSASSAAAPLTLSELELRPSLSVDRPKRGDDDRPTLARLGDDDRLDDRATTEIVLDRVSGDEGDGGLESNGDEGDGGDDDETEASAERCAGADEGPPALEGGGEEAPALVRRRAGEDMERDEKEAEPEGEEGEEALLLDRTADMSPSLLPAPCLPSRSCECS